jgi:hypothetical protein
VILQRNETGWVCTASTITKLMKRTIGGHIACVNPDAVLNIETHLYNVTLTADSCEYDLDLGKDVWLNRSRWSRLMKEYVPIEPVNRFVGQAQEILNGKARLGATANFLFRDPDRYAKKHRWGGCLMGATFRGDNKKSGKATLTFYSRTTYMGYMALLDAAIANRIAAEISEPGNIVFRWHISSQQLHCFKTLPYVYSRPKLMQLMEHLEQHRNKINEAPPTVKHMAKWFCKVQDAYDEYGVKMLDHEKYGPFKRIKRRWLEHKGYSKKNLPPSCPVSTLDFCKCV